MFLKTLEPYVRIIIKKLFLSYVHNSWFGAWLACLKMMKVRLELLTDTNMHLFIEKGIRGGVAMISHH